VEELKKRTLRHGCKKVGHWAKECKAPKNNLPKPAASSSSTHAAGCIQAVANEHFGRINGPQSLLARVRALRLDAALPKPSQETMDHQVMLVSSPGFAVLDSGCGKTIVGANTLSAFRKIWTDAGIEQPQTMTEENMFRFGNGASELSKESIEMPVCLAERSGTIRAAIAQGDAQMDFSRDELRLFGGSATLPMQVSAAGQCMISVTELQQKANKVERQPSGQESLTVESVPDGPMPMESHEVDAPTIPSVSHDDCPLPEGIKGNEGGIDKTN
jgi:hypothetical protein